MLVKTKEHTGWNGGHKWHGLPPCPPEMVHLHKSSRCRGQEGPPEREFHRQYTFQSPVGTVEEYVDLPHLNLSNRDSGQQLLVIMMLSGDTPAYCSFTRPLTLACSSALALKPRTLVVLTGAAMRGLVSVGGANVVFRTWRLTPRLYFPIKCRCSY